MAIQHSSGGKYLRAKDVISGSEGWGVMTRGDKQIDLFNVVNLKATIQLTTEDVRTLGNRVKQVKAVGSEGTGTMSVYYVDSNIRQMMHDYVNNGVVPYCTIIIQNQDPTSSTGKQTTILKNVLIKSCSAGQLDVESSVLKEDIDFEFGGYQLLESFNEVNINPDTE